jgi:hypothetical protein
VSERDYFKDMGADDRIILKWNFMKNDDGSWNSFILSRIGVRGLL